MADPLDALVRAVPPLPQLRSASVDWDEVECRLGLSLPADYRRLIETYGEGCFDKFLWLLHPTSENANLNLECQTQVRRDALSALSEPGAPDPAELVPWAFTDNGDVCYWQLPSASAPPDEWRIAVNESRGPHWFEFSLPTVEWLRAVLPGEVRVPAFPEDFPSSPPTFRSAS